MKIYHYIFLIGTLVSCSKSTVEQPDDSRFGYDYVPLEIGNSWTYQLDSIIYDPEPGRTVIDTISGQVRFEVADTFRDGQNRLAHRIDRFVRSHDTAEWVIRDVWSFVKDESQFIWTEENIPFIKLTFPVEVGNRWDGNALFNDDDVEVTVRGESLEIFKFWNDYDIMDQGEQVSILGQTYDDVLTVRHVDREILIEKRLSQEQYARDVGLIYKRLEVLDTQDTDETRSFYVRAERGFILEMQLLSYE